MSLWLTSNCHYVPLCFFLFSALFTAISYNAECVCFYADPFTHRNESVRMKWDIYTCSIESIRFHECQYNKIVNTEKHMPNKNQRQRRPLRKRTWINIEYNQENSKCNDDSGIMIMMIYEIESVLNKMGCNVTLVMSIIMNWMLNAQANIIVERWKKYKHVILEKSKKQLSIWHHAQIGFNEPTINCFRNSRLKLQSHTTDWLRLFFNFSENQNEFKTKVSWNQNCYNQNQSKRFSLSENCRCNTSNLYRNDFFPFIWPLLRLK